MVTDADARAAGLTRRQLATIEARRIADALHAHRLGIYLKPLLLGVGLTVVATAILFLLFHLIGLGARRLRGMADRVRRSRIPALRIQNLVLIDAARLRGLLAGVVDATRLVATAAVVYIYLLTVVSFFPWTRWMGPRLLGYLVGPVVSLGRSFLAYLPHAIFLVVIAVVTHYVIRFARYIFGAVERSNLILPGFHTDWAEPTFKIARFVLIVLALVVAFPYLPGSDLPAFKGISIFLGLLFSLGSTSVVANIMAGLVLTYMRGFQIGDRVKIGDSVGDVTEKTLLVTRVRTIKNEDITIPNSLVLGNPIVNYSATAREGGLLLHTAVTIGYDTPWRRVHELLIGAARDTEGMLEEPAPFVLQTALGDFFVSYELNAATADPHSMARTYSLLHQNIQDRFQAAGVEILSPHYRSVRDGNTSTVPKQGKLAGE